MRLTRELREAILRSIMNDVPEVDYDAQMVSYLSARAASNLPPLVKRVYDDKSLRPFLKTENHGYSWTWDGESYYDYFNHVGDLVNLTNADMAELSRLKDLEQAQNDLRYDLRAKVGSILKGTTTTQSFIKALPEFEKYVPKEDPKTGNLPALANIVSDFIKAGWPKNQVKEA